MLSRDALIKIAHDKPELRAKILPIIRKMGSTSKKAHGPIALKDPDVMLYMVDPEVNASKFYEMKIVPLGDESPAIRTRTVERPGAQAFVLMKRWGRLTDSGSSGRVDSMNEVYASMLSANRAMQGLRRMKTQKGYQDVTSTRQYPIGLGSAGFGWGGQAACRYIPELRQLQQQVETMDGSLQDFQEIVARLERQRSGLVPDLKTHYQKLISAVAEMEQFLQGELKECRE